MDNLSALLPHFKDKMVEICVGDQFEEIQLADFSQQVNGAVYGKFLDLVGPFILIDCLYINKNGEIVFGNKVFINSWQVKMITALDGQGSLSDILLSVTHAEKIKRLLNISDK